MNNDQVYIVLIVYGELELEPRGPVSAVLLTTTRHCLVALHLHAWGNQTFHQTLVTLTKRDSQ